MDFGDIILVGAIDVVLILLCLKLWLMEEDRAK